MTDSLGSGPLWGYTTARPRRYRAGSLVVVLFPPDAPLLVRRLLLLHRFRTPLTVALFFATSILGATIVLLEAALALALAVAVGVGDALRRATRRPRQRVAQIEIGEVAPPEIPERTLRLVSEFLETAFDSPHRQGRAERLPRLWRELYDDLVAVG